MKKEEGCVEALTRSSEGDILQVRVAVEFPGRGVFYSRPIIMKAPQ